MLIEAEAILMRVHPLQESSALLNCFTREYGLIKGFIRSKKQIQNQSQGNIIKIIKKARLESQLGSITIEPHINIIGRSAYNQFKLLAVNSIIDLINLVLHEELSEPNLYDELRNFLIFLSESDTQLEILKHYILIEYSLLKLCGFGLDLSKCVATHVKTNLIYISPKSGCAVSADAGRPLHTKLFPLPPFFITPSLSINYDDAINSLKITQHFLQKNYLSPHNLKLPFTRMQFTNFIINNYA